MPVASTIIIACEDFSIPGSPSDQGGAPSRAQLECRFFDLVSANKPDIVVLDLTNASGASLETIRKIRARADLPVLVVHRPEDPRVDDYRVCGAASCIAAPIDIVQLNQAIQRIISLVGSSKTSTRLERPEIAFAGMIFRPENSTLRSESGTSIRLTTLERNVLSHLATHVRRVCSREEISQVLYDKDKPSNDRAIDIVVSRLRKKLVSVGGRAAENLVMTEFRRGYIFSSEVFARGTEPAL